MNRARSPWWAWLTAVVLVAAAGLAGAQTKIEAPRNKYTPAEDVKLGDQAAAEVRKEFPLIHDARVTSYVQGIGRRLVAAVPTQFQHPEFHYTFSVLNASDINAFALPGGPMFVNRGMIRAAQSEGEVAGVMAHELAHVALRHGTAQATKATPYEIGTIAGQILGAIVGGTAGRVIAQGSRFGIGTVFLRYSREYERQADILGSHIMARAGYDPRAMATMFQTIEKQGGGGSPEWLSDHPDPGNRSDDILREARMLTVQHPVADTGELKVVQADLARLPPARTLAQLEKDAQAEGRGDPADRGKGVSPAGTISGELPPPPSGEFVPYDVGGLFSVRVPASWREQQGGSTVRFAPEGAFGEVNGRQAFVLGVELGVTQALASDLQDASAALIQSLKDSNPDLAREDAFGQATLDGRPALRTRLGNVSELGRPEVVVLTTTFLDDGRLFYAIEVAPRDSYASYRPTFDRVSTSITIRR